jgi:thiamine-phosphate pyrophosphorylase
MIPERGLYAIVDTVTIGRRGLAIADVAEAILAARPAVLQLRAKDLCARDTLALLRRLAPLARIAKVPLFANDRADLAALAGCDGVHVGQTDLSVADVRRVAPGLAVGVSTHDLAQLSAAVAEGPDYVALGPIFPTSSKENPDPVVGLSVLAAARAATALPLVAIGGIDLARAGEIASCGALGAVIGALLPDDARLSDVTSRATALDRALRR